MGLFCASIHFRQADEQALNAAMARRGIADYRVLPAKGGWTTLFCEQASQQDEEWIRKLAGELTRELHVAGIAFMVHDSDIACYWLFDHGQSIDEFNSCPDYFDMDSAGDQPSAPRGGRPEVLLRYCRQGVKRDDIAAILSQEATFAESLVEQLAEALGIDPGRALGDYRHDDDDGGGPGGFGGFGGGDEDDDDDDGDGGGFGGRGPGSKLSSLRQGLAGQLLSMLGGGSKSGNADPQATALVQAAASGDVGEITRLLSVGVAVDAEAPAPLPAGQPMAGAGQMLTGMAPQVVMTPLLTAVVHKQTCAVELLLDRGAELNRVHPLFGTPIHSATGAGDTERLKLLIDRGGDVNARNAQGQTALELLAASRTSLARLAQAQSLMKSMGHKVAGLFDQLSKVELPADGWDRCERLLEAHGAR